jgi:Ca2+-binding EF-hand superfamily protein
VLGSKGLAFFRRLGLPILASTTGLGDKPHLKDLLGAVNVMLDDYKDGGIDRVEARALGPRVVDHFDRVDGNQDGSLDARELGRARAHARAQGHQGQARKAFLRGLFIGLDDDGDGAISRAELGEKLPKLAASFAQIDRDADGRISKEEMRAHRMQRQAER